MIFFFFNVILSTPIHLSDDNFTEFINETSKLPIFLKLWASWCPHCKEMEPQWDALTNINELDERVAIADIECEANRKSCKLYDGNSFPRLYWIDRNDDINGFTKYEGPKNLEHFLLFIKKQLQFPLVTVNDTNWYSRRANVSTAFLFKFTSKDKNMIDIAKNVSLYFRNIESHFLLMENTDKTELIAFIDTDKTVLYNGNWDFDSLHDFIQLYSLPFLVDISSYVIKHFDTQQIPTFIYLTNVSKIPTDDELSLFDKIKSYYPLSKTTCDQSDFFCRYIGISLNISQPKYVIYDKHQSLYWIYPNETFNKEMILKWAEDVKSNKIKGSGPGNGFLSIFTSIYYKQRADGNPTFIVFFIPVFFVIGLIFLIISFTDSPGEISKNRPAREVKKIKND